METYTEARDTFVGRSYRVQPAEHVGHVVTIEEADPPDHGALRAHCSCGKVWAIDLARVADNFDRHAPLRALSDGHKLVIDLRPGDRTPWYEVRGAPFFTENRGAPGEMKLSVFHFDTQEEGEVTGHLETEVPIEESP